jgi:hypothetical protein
VLRQPDLPVWHLQGALQEQRRQLLLLQRLLRLAELLQQRQLLLQLWLHLLLLQRLLRQPDLPVRHLQAALQECRLHLLLFQRLLRLAELLQQRLLLQLQLWLQLHLLQRVLRQPDLPVRQMRQPQEPPFSPCAGLFPPSCSSSPCDQPLAAYIASLQPPSCSSQARQSSSKGSDNIAVPC